MSESGKVRYKYRGPDGPVVFVCAGCGAKLRAPLGASTRCPRCKAVQKAPAVFICAGCGKNLRAPLGASTRCPRCKAVQKAPNEAGGLLEWRYYSNPFWADGFDPSLDADARKAGALGSQAEAARPDVARDRTLGWIGWVVAGVLLPIIIWSAPGGDIVLGFAFLVAAPVIAIVMGGAKSRALRADLDQREVHLQRTFQHSYDRYQAWLGDLAANDSQMYANVVAWQQANATQVQLKRLESIQRTNALLTGVLAINAISHMNQHHNQ